MEIITVNYNTPDLVERLVKSVRMYYENPITIIDGSSPQFLEDLYQRMAHFDGISIFPQGYNIHHGRGMDLALQDTMADRCLIMDSDNYLKHHFLEDIPEDIPIFGWYCYVDDNGVSSGRKKTQKNHIKYFHPSFMVIDPVYYREKGRFIHHGAPCIDFFRGIQDEIDDVAVDMCEYFDISFQDLNGLIELKGRVTRNRFGNSYES